MKVAFSITITPLSKNAGDEKYRTTHKKLDRMKKNRRLPNSHKQYSSSNGERDPTPKIKFLETYTHICVGKTHLFTFCVLHYLAGNNS